ncbi:MAG: hypothetical protein ABSE59_01730 [Opitutaceae bacterium]
MKTNLFFLALSSAFLLAANPAARAQFAAPGSRTGDVPLGAGWSATTESYSIQTSAGCTVTPNSSGGGTFSVPSGRGRAEFRFKNLSKSKTEQFEGFFTVNRFPSTSRQVSVKQLHGLDNPWSIVEVTPASGGGLELVEFESNSTVLLKTVLIGTIYQMNTIYNPMTKTYDVYVNGTWVEEMATHSSDTFYNKIGAYTTDSGNGPAMVTWTNIAFWTGGTKPAK